MKIPKLKRHSPPVDMRRRPQIAKPSVARERVFSYHASRVPGAEGVGRGVEPATLLRKRAHRHWRKRAYTLLIVTLLVFLVVDSLRLSSTVKVVSVTDSGGEIFLRSEDVYKSEAQKLFGSLLNRNKLTANTNAIADRLRSDFPELKTVSISMPVLGRQPVVYIQPVAPRLLVIAQDNTMYVVDGSGTALINAAQVPDLGKLDVPTLHDQSGVAPEVGKLALPSATVSFITTIAAQMQTQGIGLDDMTLLVGGNQLNVKAKGEAYYAKFDIHGDAREEAGAFAAVKQSLESAHKTPKEYVDVRVEGKAYYK